MTYKDVAKGQEKIERDLTKERDERCVPIAKQVMKLIGDFDGPFLPTDRMEFVKAWDPLIEEIVHVLQEANLPIAEWGYVMQIAQIPFDHTKNWVAETIVKNMDNVLENFWDKPTAEVTFTDIALKKRGMLQSN